MIHTGIGARKVSEENSRVFRVAGAQGDSSGLNLKDVVGHDALGHTPFGRVDAFDTFATPNTWPQQEFWNRSYTGSMAAEILASG